MRATLCLLVIACSVGCNIFHGYWYSAKHFRYGTVKERQYGKPLKHTYGNVQLALRERGFSIKKAEIASESAQIVAVKDGIETIFDLKEQGEGTHVHMEISQAGNDGDTWAILTDIDLLP